MSDVRETIRNKIRDCLSIITQLREPAERIVDARQMREFYAGQDLGKPAAQSDLWNADVKLEKACESAAPIRDSLVKLLREIAGMSNAADAAGFDLDFSGIQAFIAQPDSTKAPTLKREFELIYRQLSVDPVPTGYSTEFLLQSPEIANSESAKIASMLESELRNLQTNEADYLAASAASKKNASDKDLQWRLKRRKRQLIGGT